MPSDSHGETVLLWSYRFVVFEDRKIAFDDIRAGARVSICQAYVYSLFHAVLVIWLANTL
jgi:hypothetical protein